MNTFIIERNVPGASQMSHDDLVEIARTSNRAVESLGLPYEWVTTYVAGDKLYCIHRTDEPETVREHARRGGFPADLVSEVVAEFGPQTADDGMPSAEAAA
ncbi:DUF4242 domain-containing protein [Microbacterium sp. NPDC058389]|uniref:DUF4242 domain-containing protein n=1 Tax=Microbacterium sp. NPDC058389 TaxID=3346475 RepID=UPI00365F02D7